MLTKPSSFWCEHTKGCVNVNPLVLPKQAEFLTAVKKKKKNRDEHKMVKIDFI